MNERERLQLLQAATQEMVADLPAWDGESPAVLVTYTDPVTRLRLGHRFVPATAAPQPKPQTRPRLRLVEAS
ncbi:hypothetical protein [Streptomyces sp. NPDC058291]|uniref:hypothetical protein n=1 Tax=Streptomyces sp. NPDC058291 TaxID=3346427 RepID=UPI0036ED6CB4